MKNILIVLLLWTTGINAQVYWEEIVSGTTHGEVAVTKWDAALGEHVGSWHNLQQYLTDTLSINSLWLPNGSDIYYNSGNVGIGTTSPANPLNIVEFSNSDIAYLKVNNTIPIRFNLDGKAGYDVSLKYISDNIAYTAGIDGDDDDNYYLYRSTFPVFRVDRETGDFRHDGNVGINVDPTVPFHALGTSGIVGKFEGTSGVIVSVDGLGASVGSRVAFEDDDQEWSVGKNASDVFVIQDITDASAFVMSAQPGTQDVRFYGNGGFGVAPTEALDVLGSIKMVDGNEGIEKFMKSDANGVAFWAKDNYIYDVALISNDLTFNSIESGFSGTIDLSRYLDNTDDQNLTLDSLTVGTKNIYTIGIEDGNSGLKIVDKIDDADNDPTNELDNTDEQTLDVSQLVGTDLQLSIENDGEATKIIDLSSLQDGTGTDDQTLSEVLTEGDDGGGLDIVNIGNIGIGTASPSYELDIDGGHARLSNLYLSGLEYYLNRNAGDMQFTNTNTTSGNGWNFNTAANTPIFKLRRDGTARLYQYGDGTITGTATYMAAFDANGELIEEPLPSAGAAQLNELSDVNTSTPTNRNVLIADGVDWESRPLVEADISDLSHTVDTDTQLSQEQVEDYAGGMATGNTETLITVTYQDADGTIDYVVDNDLSNYDNGTSGFLTSEIDGSVTNELDGDGIYGGNGTVSDGTTATLNGKLRFDRGTVFGAIENNNLDFSIGTVSSDKFHLFANDINIVTVEPGGEVGINTDAPNAALDVEGDVKISDDFEVDGTDFFVDVSLDRIGVGTATPNTELDIKGTAPALTITDDDLTAATKQDLGTIQFYTDDTSGAGVTAEIRHIADVSTAKGSLGFRVGTVSGGLTEALYLDGSTGFVGVGTQAPAHGFHQYGTVAQTFEVESLSEQVTFGLDNDGTATKVFRMRTNGGTQGGFKVGTGTKDDWLYFQTGGSTDRVVIDEDGNVGIGDLTPDAKLDVDGDTELNGNITWSDRGLGEMYDGVGTSSTSATYAKLAFNTSVHDLGEITVDVATNERITIDNTGLYEFDIYCNMDQISGGEASLRIYKNGTQLTNAQAGELVSSVSGFHSKHISGFLSLSNTDYLEIWYANNTGTGTAFFDNTRFTIKRLTGF